MKLHGVTEIDYNISDELQDLVIERTIRELHEDIAPIVASWYILNESTQKYEIDQNKLDEGIKDILKKGADKINDIMMKGRVNLDMLKGKVVDKLKGNLDQGALSKLGNLAKKNSKFVKPALMVAVVGAALLGMDTASASEALNQMDQMGGQDFANYMDQMQQGAQEFAGGDAGGADGGGQQAQMPQEDQPTQYNADSGGGQVSPKLKSALIDKVDGIFKIGDSQAEGGLKTLNSKQAIHLAQQMTGQEADQVIQKIMQNTDNPADMVRAFKDWVGTGVKKYAMR